MVLLILHGEREKFQLVGNEECSVRSVQRPPRLKVPNSVGQQHRLSPAAPRPDEEVGKGGGGLERVGGRDKLGVLRSRYSQERA